MKKLLPLFILLLAISSYAQMPKAPSGWRFPTIKDVKGNWKSFKKELPTPYKIKGDFNNDKLIDEVWILIPTTGKGLGLFAFLKQKNNNFRSVQLDYAGDGNPQEMYITIAEPERYDKACGKGYWDCAQNEPPVLNLKTKGIAYGIYESAMSIYYWDSQYKSFKNIAISD
jgi:hypothetical protein